MPGHLQTPNRLRFYLSRMAARGFSADEVLYGTGLDATQLQESNRRILTGQFRRVIRNMLELTDDLYLGIALGEEFKISNLGILGYAALSAANLAQSSEVFDRYGSLNELIVSALGQVRDGR